MRRRTFWLGGGIVLGSLALAATGFAGEAQKKPKPRTGGLVVFGADQEPRALNTQVVQGSNQATTTMITNAILQGAFEATPQLRFKPVLLAGMPKVTRNPFTITYRIHPKAKWNDGRHVSAEDFEFTRKTLTDPRVRALSRRGFEDIEGAQIMNNKTIKFFFKKPFAPWKTLFGRILPKHALEKTEALNTVWMDNLDNPKTGRPISNGPFQLGDWSRGSQLTIVRNPNYWGRKAYLSRITFRFIPNTQTQAQQIQGREVDMINPQPQLFLVPLKKVKGLKVQSSAGPTWEHIDFNLGYQGRGDPALRKRFVRQAIAYGINRDALTRVLFRTIKKGLVPLHNPFFMNGTKYYKPYFNKYKYNQKLAIQLLERNGCSRGADRIYSCQGDRLSFRFVTTSGNQLRELTQQIVQQALKTIGVEVRIQNGPSEVVFGPVINQGNYDMFLFAWVGTPDPGGNVNIYACPSGNPANPGRPQNRQGYCNATVTRLLERTDEELNEAKRMGLFNQAVRQMVNDVPLIPLYQKPTFLVQRTTIQNVVDNPTNQGALWRAGDWWVSTAS